MDTLCESDVEGFAVELPEQQGYAYLSTEEQALERRNLSEIFLCGRLKPAVDKLDSKIPNVTKEQALREVLNLPHKNQQRTTA